MKVKTLLVLRSAGAAQECVVTSNVICMNVKVNTKVTLGLKFSNFFCGSGLLLRHAHTKKQM